MKKVLFVGVFHPNSTNVAQVRAFSNNGCQAYAYDYRAKLSKFNSIYIIFVCSVTYMHFILCIEDWINSFVTD